MNSTKQFQALFKFQASINPTIWVLPLAFGVPFILPFIIGPFSATYHPSFFSLFSNQNLIFVGIFGTMILAPEKFQFGGTSIAISYYGNEFVMTRAIDRPVLYRAKAALMYLLILLLPCVAIIHSLKDPDLIVMEYSKPVQQECLAAVSGSALLPSEYKESPSSLILIPRGNILVAEWQFWILCVAGLTLQLLLMILYPFKYGRVVFWVLYFGLILVPLFDLTHLGKNEPTINDQLFFSFAAHQPLILILTALVFVLGQLWCERRFARLEQ